MAFKACIPIIPSADLEKSLNFWVEGLGITADQEMRKEGRLVGCMVHDEQNYFWLNQRAGDPIPEEYNGIALYWTPADIHSTWKRLKEKGLNVSDFEDRDYGQTEFFLTDIDGYSHCFGVATESLAAH
jgi:hypothetical protein